MKPSLIIAIDQGGHASRAIAFDLEGNAVAQAFSSIQTYRQGEDRVEHDPSEIVASIRLAVNELERKLGADVERVVCAGLATQRSSIACWDSVRGVPLAPVLSWQDRRNAALIETLRPHAARIHSATGLMLSPHYGASKIRWCLENIDAVRATAIEQRLRIGPLASYLMRSLLLEQPELVDPANASRTLLWDPATQDWSAELLALFDIPISILPSCMPSRNVFGSLSIAGRSVPLQVCTGDQNAAVFADGDTATDTAYLNVGTGAFLLATTNRDPGEAAPLLRSVLFSDQHEVRYAIEGTVNGAGSALDWYANHAHVDAHKLARALTQIDSKSIPVFVNGVSGVGSPYWRPRQVSYFNDDGDERACVAAVLESIAFLIAENFQLMRTYAGALARIHGTGGLIESDYLCHCIASLCKVPVYRSQQQEATARGLAFLCAGNPGVWSRAKTRMFVPAENAYLNARHARWRAMMESTCSSRPPPIVRP